jgi:hypothetical protein
VSDAGAFVEYPQGKAAPSVDGVNVSHAEPSDTPGMERIYYFYPEDYPELAHQDRVERERGLETFLEVYRQLNNDPEDQKR